MTKKALFSMLVGVFLMAMAGLATAGGAPVSTTDGYGGLNYSEMPAQQPGADPESHYSNSLPWQEREPLETGSIHATQGDSPELRCCEGDIAPMQGEAGETLPRPGIDDGP